MLQWQALCQLWEGRKSSGGLVLKAEASLTVVETTAALTST